MPQAVAWEEEKMMWVSEESSRISLREWFGKKGDVRGENTWHWSFHVELG